MTAQVIFQSKLFIIPCQTIQTMKKSNLVNDLTQARKPSQAGPKKVNPKVYVAMQNYQKLKKQLIDHFFEGQPLNISNKQFSFAYTDLYNLLNDSSFVVQNGKQQYQSIEQSFLSIYKNDLKNFSGMIYEQIQKSRGLHPEDEIKEIARWVNIYARFNHWIFKMFMIIERNAMMAQGIRLYFQGIKILKDQFFQKIYDDLYRVVFQTLELYKKDLLKSFEPLQLVIRYIGIIGFSKFKLVEMVKTRDDRFQYQSKKETAQPSENPYSTDYFKTNFLSRLVKDLKSKYSEIVSGMMQLSISEYFQKAKYFIDKEEDTADLFYGFPVVKETVIRYVLQTLIVENAETLLKDPKSGLTRMMQEKDVRSLVKIYELLKKSNMQRVFFKEFQSYIQSEGENILTRVTAEDEKTMKKQTIQMVLKEIIEFNQLIDTIRTKIDIHDAELQKAQNTGFQGFCNVGNRVCNYLALYADMMLKKEAEHSSGEDIVVQVGKISKYLYSYDYFMKEYQKLLGLRILYDNFKNEEAEFALINMLKTEAGINATSKISNMIQDQKSSEGWNSEFQLKNKFGFGMDVMMLTSGSWEINDPKCGKNHVPPQLMPAVEEFEDRFLKKMPNRSVSWIFTHGRAIVQFIPESKLKHILILNNYQLLTLLFLKRQEYAPAKYGDLLSELKIQDESFFKSSMLSMLKNGVLVKQGTPVKIDSKNDELRINLNFKHKNTKISCSIIPKYTQKTATTSAPVSAERCILIDAALVKIMKQRRRAPYQQVILQVQKMCRTFKAEISQIKLRIQNCQQRQFLQRDPNDMNILIYKP